MQLVALFVQLAKVTPCFTCNTHFLAKTNVSVFQGAGVGALLALRLNTEESFKKDLGAVKVTCMGVATAACLTG